MATLPSGHSGYFSAPSHGLDPALFDAEHLKPAVREHLLKLLTDALQHDLKLTGWREWLTAWIAGSGVTYQWGGDRGATGDLDVLFGVDYKRFAALNPRFAGLPESDAANYVTSQLKEELWPRTANTSINGKHFEVTYFWNPGTGRDIRSINPYAAYDMSNDKWAVRPPSLPQDPRSLYSQEWFDAADRDTDAARSIVDLVRSGSNADRANGITRARTLFDALHQGRRAAFGEQGKGYGDWANFRWQRAKETGVVAGLNQILQSAHAAQEESDADLYGGTPEGPDVLLTRAMLSYQNPRYQGRA
jgi:hypothetical protein